MDGGSTASRLQTGSLQGISLLFTTQSPGRSFCYSINFDRMKSGNNLELESRTMYWEFSVLTARIIGKNYLKCKCPALTNIKQTLHNKVAIE